MGKKSLPFGRGFFYFYIKIIDLCGNNIYTMLCIGSLQRLLVIGVIRKLVQF